MAARDIQFVIRAQDQATAAFNSIADALSKLMTAQGSLQGSVDGVNTDLSSLLQTLGSFNTVAATVTAASDRAGEAYERQKAKIAELNSQLAALEAQSKNANAAMASIQSVGAATGQDAAAAQKIQAVAAAQTQLAKNTQATTAQIVKEQATLGTLATQYQRVASLANTVSTARPMVNQLGASGLLPGGAKGVEEEAVSLTKFGMAATTNARAITELVVLAREASRDNFSRMAGSFTILLQAMGLMKASFLIPFAGLAALITGVVVAMTAMADEAERLRTLDSILRANADGANYNAKAIASNVDQLRAYRIAANDAMEAARAFIKEGVNPQDFVAFGETSKDATKVDPSQFKDVKDAAKQIAEAFTGGYDAIAKLDDATNFLSQHEREHIRTMFDEGQAADARTRAFNDFRKAMRDGAGEMDSTLTPAVDRLAGAWSRFGESLENSKFGKFADSITDDLSGGLDRLGTLIAGKGKDYSQLMLHFAEEEKAGLEANDPNLAAGKEKNDQYTAVLEKIAALKKQIADYDKQDASATAQASKVDPAAAAAKARQQAVADAQKEFDRQKQLDDATTSYDRIRVAGEQAYQKELEKSGNAELARIERLKAEETIRKDIERSAIATFTKNVVGAEGGPGQNPSSTAVGYGQFTDARWIEEFKKALPELADGMSRAAILAKRTNKDTATVVIEQQARDLADALKKSGAIISATNLYLAHFLGVGGAEKVLNADPNTPVNQIGLSKGTLSGNQSYLRTDNGKGRYRTTGELQQFIGQRIGDTTDDQYGAERQAIADLVKKQQDLNREIGDESAKRAIAIKYLQQEQGATADVRNQAERQKTIEEAVQQAKDKAAKAGTALSAAQQKDIEDQTGKVFDLDHAEKLVNDRLSEQQQLRDALLQGIKDAITRGDDGTVALLTKELNDAKPAMQNAIDLAIKFWEQFDTPESHTALENLHHLQQEINDTAAAIAKAKADAAANRASGASDLLGSLQSAIGTAEQSGDAAGAKQLEQAYTDTIASVIALKQTEIDTMGELLKLSDAELASQGLTRDGIEATIVKLQQEQQQAAATGREFLMTGKQINEMIADQMVSGIENFLTMVEQGKGVIKSFGIAVLQTLANVGKSIGEMILKQTLFNLIAGKSGQGGIGGSIASAAAALFPPSVSLKLAGVTLQSAGTTLTTASVSWRITASQLMAAAQALAAANASGGGGGGGGLLSLFSSVFGGGGFGALPAGTDFLGSLGGAGAGLDFGVDFAALHTGGVAGSATMRRSVSPSVFADAMRYHLGGVAGLRPNEVPTILEAGEEVLTKGDPRHRNNGGMGGDVGLKQVLVFDPADIASAMASSEGRRVLLTFIRGNKREVSSILSGNG